MVGLLRLLRGQPAADVARRRPGAPTFGRTGRPGLGDGGEQVLGGLGLLYLRGGAQRATTVLVGLVAVRWSLSAELTTR